MNISVGAGSARESGARGRWFTAAFSLVVGAAFFALWFWLLPPLFGFQVGSLRVAGWHWVAALASVLGFAVAVRCVWDFGWTGRGTPAPLVPPKRLVVVGPYRYVRNPMYLGFSVGWVGLWVVFGRWSSVAAIVVAAVAIGVALFVRLYEEPTLRRLFGSAYEDYCRNVPRWLPRVRPWVQRDG